MSGIALALGGAAALVLGACGCTAPAAAPETAPAAEAKVSPVAKPATKALSAMGRAWADAAAIDMKRRTTDAAKAPAPARAPAKPKAKSNGAKSNGAKSNGVKSNGAKSNGAKSSGAKANGAKSDAAKSNVAKSNAAKSHAAKSNAAKSKGNDPAAAAKVAAEKAAAEKAAAQKASAEKAAVAAKVAAEKAADQKAAAEKAAVAEKTAAEKATAKKAATVKAAAEKAAAEKAAVEKAKQAAAVKAAAEKAAVVKAAAEKAKQAGAEKAAAKAAAEKAAESVYAAEEAAKKKPEAEAETEADAEAAAAPAPAPKDADAAPSKDEETSPPTSAKVDAATQAILDAADLDLDQFKLKEAALVLENLIKELATGGVAADAIHGYANALDMLGGCRMVLGKKDDAYKAYDKLIKAVEADEDASASRRYIGGYGIRAALRERLSKRDRTKKTAAGRAAQAQIDADTEKAIELGIDPAHGKAHVEEMIGYHALFEDFQRDGVVPASWATYRATAALHRVVSTATERFETARVNEANDEFEAVLAYLAREIPENASGLSAAEVAKLSASARKQLVKPLELGVACRVEHLRAHTRVCQCRLAEAASAFSAVIAAVAAVHKEELAALTAKDPEVEQILLDAYVHRAMLAWFQAGAAEASSTASLGGGPEMDKQFRSDFSAVRLMLANYNPREKIDDQQVFQHVVGSADACVGLKAWQSQPGALGRRARRLAFTATAYEKMQAGALEDAVGCYDDVLELHEPDDADRPQALLYRSALRLLLADSKECELYALAKVDWETAGQAESAAMDTAMQLAALEAVVPNLSSPVAARLDKQAAIKEKVANAQAAVKLKESGNKKIQAKKFTLAASDYTQALDLDPSNYACWSNRSLCKVQLGDFAGAMADARDCIKVRPDFFKGYVRLAQAMRGETKGAPLESLEAVLAVQADGEAALRGSANNENEIANAVSKMGTDFAVIVASYPKTTDEQD